MNTEKKLHISIGLRAPLQSPEQALAILAPELCGIALVPEIQLLPLLGAGHVLPYCIWSSRASSARHLHQCGGSGTTPLSVAPRGTNYIWAPERESGVFLGLHFTMSHHFNCTFCQADAVICFIISVLTFAFLALFMFDQWSKGQSEWPNKDKIVAKGNIRTLGVRSTPSHRSQVERNKQCVSVSSDTSNITNSLQGYYFYLFWRAETTDLTL